MMSESITDPCGRTRWHADLLSFTDEPMALSLIKYKMSEDRVPDPDGELMSSYIAGSKKHAPVLDIDIPMRLIPSTTPGHSHLYIDLPMSRTKMMFMLWALKLAGVIEMGFFWWCLRRGGTFVRIPSVRKTEAESMKYTYGMFLKMRPRRGNA